MSESERRAVLRQAPLLDLLEMVIEEYHRNCMLTWKDHLFLQELETRVIESRRLLGHKQPDSLNCI